MINIRQFNSLLATSTIAVTSSLISVNPALSQSATFICDTDSNGSHSTVVRSQQYGDVPIIVWTEFFKGAGYSAKTRCDIVSNRFQHFSNEGTLKFFTSGKVNRLPVICVVASQDSPCNNDSLLFTLKPGANAQDTLKRLFDIRSSASSNPLYENSNSDSERIYLDFEALLEQKAQDNTSSYTVPQQPQNGLF